MLQHNHSSLFKDLSTKQLQPAKYLQFRSLTPQRTERRNAIITQCGRKQIAHALKRIIYNAEYSSMDSSEASSALVTRFMLRFSGRVSSRVNRKLSSI